MVTTVKNYKKNIKTGKNEATGTSRVIGNVAQQGGGYAKGTVATQNSRGQVITQLPQNNNIQALSGPVYGIPQQQNIVPNTSTEQGAVFTPPPISIQGGGAPIPASFEQNPPPQSPAASSSPSSSPTAPQGEPTPQMRQVRVVGEDGLATLYNVDPNLSFISQTGQYEHPFWSTEGQRERIKNAFETTGFRASPTAVNGQSTAAGGAITAGIDVIGALNLLSGAKAVFTSLSTMNKIGSLAAVPGGAKAVTSTMKEAAAVTSKTLPAAGEVSLNTATAAQTVDLLKALKTTKSIVSLGGLLTFIGLSVSGAGSVEQDGVTYSKDSGLLQMKLRRVGLTDMADELYRTNKNLREDIDTVLNYLPYIGTRVSKKKLNEARDILYDAELEYEKELYTEEKTAQAQQVTDSQTFQREQQQSSQDFQRSEREARQTYEQQQQDTQYQRQLGLDATETQPSEGSTLNFGLLTAGGATEFVNKDKAAQYYFKSSYDELTPEQKMLLNLLKGGN